MPKYKTITLKKAGGGTRRQKVQVLASGKYKFVKNSTKTRKTTTRKRRTTRKGDLTLQDKRAYSSVKPRVKKSTDAWSFYPK
jgi:hypothetical protein